MKHLIDSTNLTKPYIQELINLATSIIDNPEKYSQKCKGKILATLFYEPSTRTRLSFESAMLSLGGNCLGFHTSTSSSATKGESIADTVRTLNSYSNIIAMRHPKEGSALVASQYSKIPVINAGDGGHQHPTQTLTDLLTITQIKNTLENINVAFCGDLKFGRTVHSLIKVLSMYSNNKFYLISPEELKIPAYIRDSLIEKNIEFIETPDLEEHMNKFDILYMTRVQRERFFNEEDYVRLKDSYILDRKKLGNAKVDMGILHPLPRVNEISKEVDNDSRAKYFEQVTFGKFIRMALILKLLEVE
ncbi:MAG: aspartate carbamoyltransferase [Lachnospirales bacterium]